MVNRERVFVDSNVWFSAFYKKGTASDLIKKLFQKKFAIVISELVLEEIIRNIKEKIPATLLLVYQFFQEYPIIVVKNPPTNQIQRFIGPAQKKDLPLLVSALRYRCHFFITGNKRDFKINIIKKKYRLRILNPREMLQEINSD